MGKSESPRSKINFRFIAILIGITLIGVCGLVGLVSGAIPATGTNILGFLPFILLAVIILLFTIFVLGTITVSLTEEFIEDKKLAFLQRNGGIETNATVISVERYQGDGLSPSDPCFRGKYQFIDHDGHWHAFGFKHWYDAYALNQSIMEQYQMGAQWPVIYWKPFPFVHSYVLPPPRNNSE